MSDPVVELRIIGNPNTGGVQLTGPLDNSLITDWLLNEARRIIDRRTDERARLAASGLVVAPASALPPNGRGPS